MADDPHGLITGTIWLKLKEDVRDFRVFNRQDLACAAYFHIRRLLLIQPGWSCRSNPPLTTGERRPPLHNSDLALFSDGKLQALFHLEFHLTPDMTGGFPTAVMNERMTALRQTVQNAEQSRANSSNGGRGYLVGVFDTEEEWFYPDQTVWERQSCFWLPVNCRTFADYADWHQRWERLARLSNR
jgi:hypothetical protein